jgi:GDPmannose 4,6-dehydratase
MYTKTAIITGISGQDGSFLAELLLKKNYRVVGVHRNKLSNTFLGLNYLGISNLVILEECDLLDITQIISIFKKFNPEEVYNLSAQSSVSISFQQPIGTFQYNTLSVLNLLEGIRLTNSAIKFYQASSSEMYGSVNKLPITENSIMHPVSPYAVSKAASHWLCVNYRESYGMFICCGILFNHESYIRSNNFFIKKVIQESIQISKNKQHSLKVGNIDIKRDFGYAPKYVEAMYLMLQHNTPENFLICSGVSISLREIINYIFEKLSIPNTKLIEDKNLYRPTDIIDTFGNPQKAKSMLGWEYNFKFFEVIDILLEEELTNS